jgi:lipopolysaccharide export system protein LptA
MKSALSRNFLPVAFFALVFGLSPSIIPARAAEPAAAPVPTELRSQRLEMSSTDAETFAIATGDVILTGTNLRINCDRLEITALRIGDKDATVGTLEKIKYILAIGNVRIVQGDREATCQRAEVFPREDKVVLTEDPVIIDRSNGFVGAGEKITLFRGKREVFVDKPRFTGPPVGDLSATAAPKPAAAKPAAPATPPPAANAPASTVTFPRPAR